MLGYGYLAGATLWWVGEFPLSGAAFLLLACGFGYAAIVMVGRQPWPALLALGTAMALAGFWLSPAGIQLHPLALLAMLQLSVIILVYLWHFLFIPPLRLRVLAGFVFGLLALWWLAVLTPAPPAVPAGLLITISIALGLLEQGRFRWIGRDHRRAATLSVIVICKNEADRIAACLDQVSGWADEIVVVDSGSNDGTLDIVRTYTDQVWELDWHGYGRQKQLALERASGDWVLSIDADERVTAELRREIDAWLSRPSGLAGFRIAWVSEVFGKPVFFGADGRYHCRLFRRIGARFNDADVHEDVELIGRVVPLGAPVCHVTFRNYAHLKEKMTRYALISANRIASHRRISPAGAWARMLISFALLYLRRLGFLDGYRGVLMATVYAIYTFDKYAAAWAQGTRAGSNDLDDKNAEDYDQRGS